MDRTVRLVLSDEQWARIERLCPGKAGDAGGRGRDDRMFVEGVLWLARTGAPWRDLPAVFGRWNSVFQRFGRWGRGGVWRRLFAALSDDPARLRASDPRRHPRARPPARGGGQGGSQAQAIGRSRGGPSTKIHVAVRGLASAARCGSA